METKLITMILGVALVLAATATIYTQSASAVDFGRGGNGVTGGTAPGLATACSHPNVEQHNQNCG